MQTYVYLVLASLLGCAITGGLGYRHGVDAERGRAALEQQQAIIATFDAAHRDAAAESARRAEAAVRDASRAARAREVTLRGQIDALKNARPGCDWPEPRRVLINEAVRASNGADPTPAAPGLRGRLPAAADAR